MRAVSESMPCAAPCAFTPTAGSEQTTVGETTAGLVVRPLDDDRDVADVADAPHLGVGQDRRPRSGSREREHRPGRSTRRAPHALTAKSSVEVHLGPFGHAPDLLDEVRRPLRRGEVRRERRPELDTPPLEDPAVERERTVDLLGELPAYGAPALPRPTLRDDHRQRERPARNGLALLPHERLHVVRPEPALARRAARLPARERLDARPGARRRPGSAVHIDDAGLDLVEEPVHLGLVLR